MSMLTCCGPPQQEEEEVIGDVDLFSLAADNTELTVNAKWLQHLQVCFCVQDKDGDWMAPCHVGQSVCQSTVYLRQVLEFSAKSIGIPQVSCTRTGFYGVLSRSACWVRMATPARSMKGRTLIGWGSSWSGSMGQLSQRRRRHGTEQSGLWVCCCPQLLLG